MPIQNYGVWKAKAVSYTYETDREDPCSPHLSLMFSDDELGEGRAAINIKSGDKKESRLAYWLVEDFQNPIIHQLEKLNSGFRTLKGDKELAFDYIRGSLFQMPTGKILPHDIPGGKNDIIDALKPVLDQAISRKAVIYLYGEPFNNGKGIHNVHMNQGNQTQWENDNGVFQDGGFVLQFKDHWEAVFIGFASQAIHTEDCPPKAGYPIPRSGYKTWNNFLNLEITDEQRKKDDLAERPVSITEALVNPPGPDQQPGIKPETVTLTNRTAQTVDLAGWKLRNKAGQFQELPGALSANKSKTFEVPNCPLTNKDGFITLLNSQGLKVHSVCYIDDEATKEGREISFGL